MKRLRLLLPLCLLLAACNLSQPTEQAPTDVTLSPNQLPTSTPPPAVNDDVFIPPTTDITDNDNAAPDTGGEVPTCTPRTDWTQSYVIQPGDTLSVIAERTGVSTDVLASGNCLTDPNQIIVGGTLLVPRQPDAEPVELAGCTANVDFTVIGGANAVSVTPSQQIATTCLALNGGATVTVRWDNAPPTLTEVTFYRMNTTLPRADVIGVDNTPSDGFAIEWRVPDQMPPSVLFARGIGSAQASEVESDIIGIYVE